MHGEWERLDDGPLASAQMIQWYAPKTWHEIEQYWREKFGCEVDGEGER